MICTSQAWLECVCVCVWCVVCGVCVCSLFLPLNLSLSLSLAPLIPSRANLSFTLTLSITFFLPLSCLTTLCFLSYKLSLTLSFSLLLLTPLHIFPVIPFLFTLSSPSICRSVSVSACVRVCVHACFAFSVRRCAFAVTSPMIFHSCPRHPIKDMRAVGTAGALVYTPGPLPLPSGSAGSAFQWQVGSFVFKCAKTSFGWHFLCDFFFYINHPIIQHAFISKVIAFIFAYFLKMCFDSFSLARIKKMKKIIELICVFQVCVLNTFESPESSNSINW